MEDVTNNVETEETEQEQQQVEEQPKFNEEEFTKRLEEKFNAQLEEFTKQFNDMKVQNEELKADKRKAEVVEMLRAAKVDTRAIELLDINASDVEEKIKLLNDIIDMQVRAALILDMKNNEYLPGGGYSTTPKNGGENKLNFTKLKGGE